MSHPINRREFLRQTALAVPALGAVPTLLSGATGDGTPVPRKTIADLRASTIQAFVSGLSGTTLIPGDPNYEASCRHWSGRVFNRPGLIVRCAGAQDVAATVKFAADQGLDLAVRGGGHTRNSTCEGGVLINLSDMRQLNVDPGEQIAHAQAGLIAADMDRGTSLYGLATVLGECPTVGISGLTLGGGLGRLMGLYGALCDNVLSAELVTADGAVHRVSASENPDLFWAIRGGGGNFGIVTSFSYRLHPVGPVLAGMLQYPASEARAVLGFLKDYMPGAPDELDLLIEIGRNVLQYAPDAEDPTLVINVCCSGDPAAAEKTLEPLREFRRATLDTIGPMSYLEAQGMGDVTPLLRHAPPQYAGYHQSGFLAQFNDAAIEKIIAHCENPPFPSWSIALDHYMHGQVCRVPDRATAFNLRQRGFCFRTTAFQAGQGPPERATAWVRELNAALSPYSGGAMYLNYLTDQGDAGVRASFGSNYPRLARLKKKVDPDNLFRLNPNITPEA
ncbi:MAG: FAD-binding oxidoreductase [Phycisphaerae bacterium]|nr:FAD-binding oxidoreductase [Phycisphaerae bacterium]